jgi:hypothetical protein
MSITFDLCTVENNVCTQADSDVQVNFSNINAMRVLRKLGLDADYCGVIRRAQLLTLMPLAADVLVDELVKEPDEACEGDDMRMISILNLFKRAIAQNSDVSWS